MKNITLQYQKENMLPKEKYIEVAIAEIHPTDLPQLLWVEEENAGVTTKSVILEHGGLTYSIRKYSNNPYMMMLSIFQKREKWIDNPSLEKINEFLEALEIKETLIGFNDWFFLKREEKLQVLLEKYIPRKPKEEIYSYLYNNYGFNELEITVVWNKLTV